MSHTKCKLTVSESSLYANEYHLMANGNWLMAVHHNGEQMPETQRENMRRLVACWNACEVIPTEVLEANQSAPMLLETLRECITDPGATCFVRRDTNPEYMDRRLNYISGIAREAIAEITGVAP